MAYSEDSKLENIIRKVAIVVGLAMLAASMFLSYDGFDQSVGGDNPNYSLLGMAIGWTLAIAFTLAEFIITSRTEGLNSTLKWLGVFAYGYSIVTNYLGLQHILQMNMGLAVITAIVMDVFPEQMIAWGLGEAVMHDLFGNLGKFASAPIGKSGKGGVQQQQPQKQKHQQQPQPFRPNQPKVKGSDRLVELTKQYHASGNNGHNGHNEELEDTGSLFR